MVLVFFRAPLSGQASAIVLPTSSPRVSQTARTREAEPILTAVPDPSSTPTPASTPTATPLPSPTPTLPASAVLEGLIGHKQSLPLSCEASSAVDWAAYFGTEIEEGEFFAGLPADDNPELGFVGDVNGSWGQIPPDDYGVHAGPIAQRLREYGLNAKHLRYMTLEELKAEIAAGRPVIVWVVGHVKRGTPVPYTSSSGEQTTVAKFEHTVIVTGFTETKITVVDGARVYSIYEGEFMKSWNVLENQAVIWID
ncbi:MAG: C39 family peptidase [Anaerolineales bacterium]